MKNKIVISLLSIVIVVAIIINVLPKSFDSDLDKLGNGKPSIVFIYDPNLVVSNKQVTQLELVRKSLGEKANFLVIKVGNPKADRFMSKYNARVADLLIFDSNGKPVKTSVASVDAAELIQTLTGL